MYDRRKKNGLRLDELRRRARVREGSSRTGREHSGAFERRVHAGVPSRWQRARYGRPPTAVRRYWGRNVGSKTRELYQASHGRNERLRAQPDASTLLSACHVGLQAAGRSSGRRAAQPRAQPRAQPCAQPALSASYGRRSHDRWLALMDERRDALVGRERDEGIDADGNVVKDGDVGLDPVRPEITAPRLEIET